MILTLVSDWFSLLVGVSVSIVLSQTLTYVNIHYDII